MRRRRTCRRCRSSSRSRPTGSATAWSARRTTGTALRRRRRHARPPVHLLRDERRPRRRPAPAEQLDRRLPPALRLHGGRPGRPASPEAAQFNRAMRIDTRLVDPLRNLPPGSFGGRRADRRPDGQPGLPQPDPRPDGPARDRPADGGAPARAGRDGHGRSPRAQIRDGDGGAALDGLTAAQRSASSTTRRCCSTSCARRSSTAASCAGVGARIVAETFIAWRSRAAQPSIVLPRKRRRGADFFVTELYAPSSDINSTSSRLPS